MSVLEAVFATSFLFTLSFTQNDIRTPPSITRSPSEKIIYRTYDNITLACKGEGVPAISYNWKKNGAWLSDSLHNIHKGADGTITIQAATSMDEGFYQCFAANDYGAALSITTHIQRALLEAPAGTPTVIQLQVQEGMPFLIQADPRISFPKPTYRWETVSDTSDVNPIPLRPSKRIQIAENGDLYFAYVTAEDDLGGRLYRSSTYNPYLDVKYGGNFTRLILRRITGGVINQFAPTVGFASEAQTVAVIGGSVTLRCFFAGYPEPTISWTGPRNRLPIGRYTLNGFNTELTINNITATDEGDYNCAASNTQGGNSHTLQIRVEELPSFGSVKDIPYNVNVTEGQSVDFNCRPKAKPEAKVVWFRDGQELDPQNSPQRFVFSSDKKKLTIRDVCRDCVDRERRTDLMVIQCNASNVHGYAFASGYLNVLRKTTVTIDDDTHVIVKANEDKQIRFACRAQSDPSTPPSVRWYKVENNEEQPVQDDPPAVTIKDGTLTIHVNPGGTEKWTKYQGEYRCIGDNGYSRYSAAVRITVDEKISSDGEDKPKSLWWIYVVISVACFVSLVIGFVVGFIFAKRRTKRNPHHMESKRYDYVRASEIGPFRSGYPTEDVASGAQGPEKLQ